MQELLEEHHMHQQPATMQPRRWQRRANVALAALAYCAVLAGVAGPLEPGKLLSVVALAVLGAAVSRLTWARLPSRAYRLRGQQGARWKRERALALASSGAVYLALVLGVTVKESGGLWRCTALPFCAAWESASAVTVLHRGAAAAATALVVALAVQAWRTRGEAVFRPVAGWAIGLIVVQNLVGLVLVVMARDGHAVPLSSSRLAHLAIGALSWAAVARLATLVVCLPPQAPPSKHALAAGRPSLLKDYLSLTKPGVISLLLFTTLAAMLITPAGVPAVSLVWWTMLGGWLVPAGAQALNCYFDRHIDVKMGRTSRRPIPSGRIPAWHALVLGFGLGALGLMVLAVFVNLAAALLALAGYIYYAGIYTLALKRHSSQNIVIGGGAGAIPPLVGWAAATGGLSWPALALFAIIFCWTPPHFWALALIRKQDYANAGVPMLPVVAGDDETKRQILIYTLVTLALSLLPSPLGLMGWPYLAAASVLGGMFVGYVLRMLRTDTTATRWALYRFSLLYLFLLFVAMLVDRLVFA